MKFIKGLKQLICKHKWKELPRFVNLRTGVVKIRYKCVKCGKELGK